MPESETEAEVGHLPHPVLMLGRGLVRHCPRCGSGHLFESWLKLRERCPRCGLKFEREEGAFLGAFVVNFGLILTVVAAYIGVSIAVLRDPNPVTLSIIGVAMTIVVPIFFYPFSRTVWTAIDLVMQKEL
ncbi:MAG: hypothetical protein QOF60_972 [Actinomycetota bacterium]|nr:hypothetical protein [Actinomycetota bacterium]